MEADLSGLWEMLPDDPSPVVIEKLIEESYIALNQKNEEVHSKLIAKQVAMETAQTQIQQLCTIVNETKLLASQTKNNIICSKENLAVGNLKILSFHEKRQQYIALEDHVQNVKKIMSLRMELNVALKEGDFHKVMILCISCTSLLKEYPNLTCLKGINVEDQLAQVKKMLDTALADVCRPPFKDDTFLKIIKALRMTKKSSSVLRRITTSLQKYIDTATRSTVVSHVIDLENSENVKQMKFKDLITYLKEDNFSSCFSLILYQMSEIMYLNYQMTECCNNQISTLGNVNGAYFCELLEGLKTHKKILWDKMERNTTAFCVPNRLKTFKLDNFLLLLDSLNVFVNIGEQFSGETSNRLRGFIVQLSTAFYEKFHADNLSAIKSLLISENWSLCPGLSPDYSILDIREVKAMLNEVKSGSTQIIKTMVVKGNNFFESYQENGNPFVLKKRRLSVACSRGLPQGAIEETNALELIYAQEKQEKEEREKKLSQIKVEVDAKDKKRRGQPDSSPLLTTSTISLLKCMSKYIQMMKILNNISWTIFQGLVQIINSFSSTVVTNFMQNQIIISMKISNNLKSYFDQIKEQNSTIIQAGVKNMWTNMKIDAKIDTRADKMFGMEPLIIATESLVFLHHSLVTIRPLLDNLIPSSNHQNLQNLFTTFIDTMPEQKNAIFKGICNKFVSVDNIVQSIQTVNWCTDDFQTRKTTAYIDKLSNLLSVYNKRMDTLLDTSIEPMPYRVRKYLWEHMITHIGETLLEGYAMPQCSTDGRAMMGIDLQNIIQLIESTSELKVNTQLLKSVENYIKAYYQPDLDIWLTQFQADYTSKQIKCLIECGSWDKETKAALLKKFVK